MALNGIEVGVVVEKLHLVADRDSRDQAVVELARSVPAPTASTVNVGGLLVVGWPFYWKLKAAMEQPSEPITIAIVACPREDLHSHDICTRKLLIFCEQLKHTQMDNATRRA